MLTEDVSPLSQEASTVLNWRVGREGGFWFICWGTRCHFLVSDPLLLSTERCWPLVDSGSFCMNGCWYSRGEIFILDYKSWIDFNPLLCTICVPWPSCEHCPLGVGGLKYVIFHLVPVTHLLVDVELQIRARRRLAYLHPNFLLSGMEAITWKSNQHIAPLIHIQWM